MIGQNFPPLQSNTINQHTMGYNDFWSSIIIRIMKVNKSRKQIILFSIRPKNERKTSILVDSWIKVFRSFLGRIENIIICFWNLLTFIILMVMHFQETEHKEIEGLVHSIEILPEIHEKSKRLGIVDKSNNQFRLTI